MKSPLFVLKISGNSMRPYARDGDYAISSRLFHKPRTGQVMVFRSPTDGMKLIKRISRIESTDEGSRYFVEGDNRMRSTDSNSFGSIGRGDILGKVLFIARKH